MQKRNPYLIGLLCIGLMLIVYAALLGHRLRYASMGETGGGPSFRRSNGTRSVAWIRESRVDRWTGVEEERSIDYGQATAWQTTGWHPLDALLR
jgi:hypothetical protein